MYPTEQHHLINPTVQGWSLPFVVSQGQLGAVVAVTNQHHKRGQEHTPLFQGRLNTSQHSLYCVHIIKLLRHKHNYCEFMTVCRADVSATMILCPPWIDILK